MYCNTVRTEAGLKADKACITIQKLYCDRPKEERLGCVAIQHSQPRTRPASARGTGPAIRSGCRAASTHDTVARATIRQARRAGGRWVGAVRQGVDAWHGARHSSGASERRLRHGRPWLRHGQAKGHDTATVRAWARLCTPGCAQLGQVECLCTLTHFLTGLTQYYSESLNEHCSSQIFFFF